VNVTLIICDYFCLMTLVAVVYCCIVALCLHHWASVVCIDFTRLRRRRWSHRRLGSTSSHQVAPQRRSLSTPSVWSWWSHWCQRSASIISGLSQEIFPGLFIFVCHLIMAALCSRCGHYIFILWFLLLSFFFPRLISAVADWISTIRPHMMWP